MAHYYNNSNDLTSVLQQLGLSGQAQNMFGGQNSFITNLLRDRASGTNPAITQMMSIGRQEIGRATGDAMQQARERLAGSGISGANIISSLLGNQTNALGGLASQGALLNMQSQENATNQLQQQNFGQAGLAQGMFGNLMQNQQFGQSLAEQQRQFNEQLQFAKDQSETDFLDFLGGVLGLGIGGLAGGVGGALG